MRPLRVATKPSMLVLWEGMVLVLLGLAPAVGRADLVLGNLGAGDGTSLSIESTDLVAASFTMGNQDYTLSDVQIRLTFSPPFSTTFQLESDAPGVSRPSGTSLLTFTNPNFSSGARTYTFTADSPFTLAANTTYWLVGSTSNSLPANWVVSDPDTRPTGPGADFGFYADSSDSGATWGFLAPLATPMFQVDGVQATCPNHRPWSWSARSLAWSRRQACTAGEPASGSPSSPTRRYRSDLLNKSRAGTHFARSSCSLPVRASHHILNLEDVVVRPFAPLVRAASPAPAPARSPHATPRPRSLRRPG